MKKFFWPKALTGLLVVTFLLISSLVLAGDLARTTIKVDNLSCGACLDHIDTTLQDITGVEGMQGNLARGLVYVDHQPSLAGDKIARAIAGLGYPAQIVSQTKISTQESLASQPQKSTADSCCGVSSRRYNCAGSGVQRYGCSASAAAWKKLFRPQTTE